MGVCIVYVYERKCFISISKQHLRGTNLFLKMVKEKRFKIFILIINFQVSPASESILASFFLLLLRLDV